MRKADREVKDVDVIRGILDKAEYFCVGINTKGAPYVVALSFGYKMEGEKITLYFHGAKEGRKLDLWKEDDRVGVTIVISNGYVDTGYSVTADYKSIIGSGRVEILDGDEKIEGLQLLLDHCEANQYSAVECANVPIVNVFKIELEEYSAKSRF